MDLNQSLSVSYYKTIATINEPHKIYLVQHQESGKIYVKKILDVYSIDVYSFLKSHPVKGTPRIIDFFENEGSLILIEEYISGMTLREKIDSVSLTKEQILSYTITLCEILDKLHSHVPPIIHRDIKPTNILITSLDNVVLLDFNAAKYHSTEKDRESDTVLLGTQGYAAPEQYGFGESSPQTDIYSVGVILKEAANSIGAVDRSLDHIISKCTKMEPSKRYPSAIQLKHDLMKLCEEKPEVENPAVLNLPFLPPGFRTLTPWKMVIAIPAYIMVFMVCLTLEVKNSTYASQWFDRIFVLIIVLTDIFVGYNYLGIQNRFFLCRSKNKLVHALAVAILITLITFAGFILMVLIEGLVFKHG